MYSKTQINVDDKSKFIVQYNQPNRFITEFRKLLYIPFTITLKSIMYVIKKILFFFLNCMLSDDKLLLKARNKDFK